MDVVFDAIAEDQPGAKWQRMFERHWHSYSRWFLREGPRARAPYLASARAVRSHMPELVPAYEAVVECAGGGDLEARFLSMWCPPFYIAGCSQVILPGPAGALIRNYDFSPRLLEGTWLASRLLGRRVVAMIDCLWGVLDGINEDGLAASLSFGGRTAVGSGFGIPIVLRYLLETARTVDEAAAILARVPVHMSYTVALLDREGRHATVFVNPDRPAERVGRLVSTNHQRTVEWGRHAAATRSSERASALDRVMAQRPDVETALHALMAPPAYQVAYGRGYGTLYTALYRPDCAGAELLWPGIHWRQSCAEFSENSRTITFPDETMGGPA